ncbi:prenyltransferase/squalene oxidase repeat-containing protein [Streptomyces sp. SM14]|uniref:prenyltransferase/squalene oxidase repeat-containing protein n=1 Tax=Streptomyces sp. SM14 TaxID=1736045 RepID=UPI000CD56547|nr:prenyltransferase/squalene oxidase repeat-containing protein [Streptomyces sp. SM14]
MKLRRSAAALTGAALLLGAGPAAYAQDSDDSGEAGSASADGLYGETDPTYDGVWRQSATVLALHASGRQAPDAALEWLTGQQCDDGSFASFRADASAPCDDDTMADTNATALAVQALATVNGTDDADARAAVEWLREAQNEDGGWPYTPGDVTDANSTAVVIGALAATGEDIDAFTAGDASPYDALRSLQLACGAEGGAPGTYAWQPDADSGELFANEPATVDAGLAAYGAGLLVEPVSGGGAPAAPSCEEDGELPTEDAAEAGAAAVAELVAGEEGAFVPNSFADGAPDFGATTRAVLALAAGGYGEALNEPTLWLEENHTDWEGFQDSPAALAQLALAAHASGADPEDFGGTDLLAGLTALGPAEDGAGTGEEETGGDDAGDASDGSDADSDSDSDDSSAATLWILGAALLAGIGGGVMLSLNRRHAGTRDADAHAADGTDAPGDSGSSDGSSSDGSSSDGGNSGSGTSGGSGS